MRFVRNCLGAIFASMALVAVPSQAAENNGYMVDGVSFEVGVGEHVELARVGFQWDWNKDWFRTAGGWHLNGYWDLNLGWWHGDRYDDGHGSQDLAVIGRFFATGRVDRSKTIAVAGSEIVKPRYCRIIDGATVRSVVGGNVKPQAEGCSVRFISGNVLTGVKTSLEGHVGFYAHQLTAIPEGDKYELLGWAMPRFKKFSVSHAYFSWLCPRKRYNLDTNLNGGERPFVVTGLYEQYLPMDIYPMHLLKAILAGDIDKMENLGIYEVVEEDFALCEFVDPSKTEMQQIIRDGINLMIKEA